MDGLVHNLMQDGIMVTDVNRLLYARLYVATARLGLISKKKVGGTKKSWWQRRLEGSIEEWRNDLGQIDEIRKGIRLGRLCEIGWRGSISLW